MRSQAKSKKKSPAKTVVTQSDKHVLDDLLLKPWTGEREIAANAMGMLYPHIGEEGWDQFNRTKMYPGILKDIVISLYVASLDEDAVNEADATPKEAYKAARKWASEKGIAKVDSIEFWAAYAKFAKVMREVNDSVTVPAGTAQDDDEGNE